LKSNLTPSLVMLVGFPVAGQRLRTVKHHPLALVLDPPERKLLRIDRVLPCRLPYRMFGGQQTKLALGEQRLHQRPEAAIKHLVAAASLGQEKAAIPEVLAQERFFLAGESQRVPGEKDDRAGLQLGRQLLRSFRLLGFLLAHLEDLPG